MSDTQHAQVAALGRPATVRPEDDGEQWNPSRLAAGLPPVGQWTENTKAPRLWGGRRITAVLGLSAWLLLGPLPLFFGEIGPERSWVIVSFWLALSPMSLAAGLWLCVRAPSPASALLLGATPASLCLLPSRTGLLEDARGPGFWALGIAAACLVGYLAAAAQDCLRFTPTRTRWTRPMEKGSTRREPSRREHIEWMLLLAVAIGCGVLIGGVGFRSPGSFAPFWGNAAAQGATVTTVWATLASIAAVALVMGRGMRSSGRSLSSQAAARRLLWLLLVALSGGAVWLLMGH